MFAKFGRYVLRLVGPGILFFGLNCSTTDIPSTPGEPFALTRVWIMNDTQPVSGSALTAGVNTNFNVRIAFTLAESEEAIRGNLRIFVDFQRMDAGGNIVDLGVFPDDAISLNANSGVLQSSNTIGIPLGTREVAVVASLQNVANNTLLLTDVRIWPVQ